MNATPRSALLLVNLGTPRSPSTADVRRYLREFLSDPYVIDIPRVWRTLLVEGLILPTRPRRAAAAYRSIWTPEGSPLRVHGERLCERVRARLVPHDFVAVELAMRYGEPAIGPALQRCVDAGAESLVVMALFPQHSKSAWTSAVFRVHAELARMRAMLPTRVVAPFYAAPEFLDAAADVARAELESFGADHVVMSFHGLPERHVRESDLSPQRTHCLQSASCCDRLGADNRMCYRAQCYATARGLAARLRLVDAAHAGQGQLGYEVAFQSRLGRTPWIRPYSDERFVALPNEGKRRVAVLCPAFVADCLETLEEIGMRAREAFVAAGGDDLRLVPCVNASMPWVEGVAALARRELRDAGEPAESADAHPCRPTARTLQN